MTDPKAATVLREVGEELQRALEQHGPMASSHEGYAVILEELDELWLEIKEKRPVPGRVRAEAIQVAAMAVRFVMDVCDR